MALDRNIPETFKGLGFSQQLTRYTYDSLDQLIREDNQAAGKTWAYAYDNGGNITAKTEYAHTTDTLSTAIDSIAYTYDETWKDLLATYDGQAITTDEIGNLLTDGTWTYTWAHGRQLSGMSKTGTTISYAYNADGLRTSKTVEGITTQYHYVGDTLAGMTCGTDELYFTYDVLGPSAVIYNNTTYYYTRNAQGDITGIVNSSGIQVVAYTYDAWGNVLSVTGTMADTLGAANPLRYRGYLYDSETKLYYLQSRYYNPSWGRFINADTTAVLAASPDSATWDKNLFAYCDNNPLTRIDASGTFWVVGAIVGGVVSGGMNLLGCYLSGQDIDAGQLLIDVAFGAIGGCFAGANKPLVDALVSFTNSAINELYTQYQTGFESFNFGTFALTVATTAAADIILDDAISRKADDALSFITFPANTAAESAADYAVKATAREQAGRSATYYRKRAARQNKISNTLNGVYCGVKSGVLSVFGSLL